MSRIHDLDWSYQEQNQLTTCSHDGSVKFWDISSPREPFNTIKAGAQKLWRAKNYVRMHYILTDLEVHTCVYPYPYILSLVARQWLSY